jgi:hypothetical protein
MIIKLCSMGCTRHIECVDVNHYITSDDKLDLEIVTPKGESIRVLVGHQEIQAVGDEKQWQRAYIMENGRTVDTLRAPEPVPTHAVAVEVPPVVRRRHHEC